MSPPFFFLSLLLSMLTICRFSCPQQCSFLGFSTDIWKVYWFLEETICSAECLLSFSVGTDLLSSVFVAHSFSWSWRHCCVTYQTSICCFVSRQSASSQEQDSSTHLDKQSKQHHLTYPLTMRVVGTPQMISQHHMCSNSQFNLHSSKVL